MPKEYPVKECHYDLTTKKWTERTIGSTSDKQQGIDWLMHLKKKGQMATTLSHWYVGDTRVEAQIALELCHRQGFIDGITWQALKTYAKGIKRRR